MDWFIPALLTAVASASQDAWVKRYFSKFSVYEMLAFPMAYSLPLFCTALFLVPIPSLDRIFVGSFLISIPINAAGMLSHMRAIQISPLSLTLPYLAFTPVFMFLTGRIVLGEVPNAWGTLGISIIVLGSYVLNIDPGTYSPLAPIKAFAREKGSRIMLLAAFIYSLAVVGGKKAIIHSSVMFFTVSFFVAFNIVTLLVMALANRVQLSRLAGRPIQGVVAGGLLFAHAVCHGWAVSLTKAVYMISVKRISILIGAIYGGLFFSERHLIYRLLGTGLMIAGAAVITLKGI